MIVDSTEKLEVEHRRLIWHSRRGMLELDVILLPFTEKHYRQLNETDQTVYRRLIDCEDQDLFNWFMQKSKCEDTEIQRLVEYVLEHARKG